MSSSTSLTEAVKEAATQGASLTDAVKEAARSSTNATVIEFPRLALDVRPELRAVARRIAGLPVDDGAVPLPADASGGLADAPAGREPFDDPAEEPPAADAADVAPTRLRRVRPLPRARRPQAQAGRQSQPPPGLNRFGRSRRRIAFRPLTRLRGALARTRAALSARLRALARAVRRGLLRLCAAAVLALIALAATVSPVESDLPAAGTGLKRVALVLGNSAYRYARKLDSPRNDATDVGAELKRLGFTVIEGFDLDKVALDAKVRAFTQTLRDADVGVLFYAGYGLSVAGRNYLVPVDAQLKAAWSVDMELVRLDLIHRAMQAEAKTNILFLDASRDGLVPDSLARALGTRSSEIGRGLSALQGGAGTLISFSTQPGALALDGKGRNSPYSAALVKQLATSHDDLAAMLIAIRNEVMRETGFKQVPWEHSALTGRFYFNPAETTPTRALAAAEATEREAADAWSAAKDTRSLAVLDAFIARYGDTFYAELARARRAELSKTAPTPEPGGRAVGRGSEAAKRH
jgi:uncharacterized caspase-like protein